jgi:hypothetical protein
MQGGGLVLSFPTRPPTASFIPKSEVVLGISGKITYLRSWLVLSPALLQV